MNTLNALRALARVKPYMELQEAFVIAEALSDKPRRRTRTVHEPWWTNHTDTVAFARKCANVMQFLPDKKIQAIKALREEAGTAMRAAGADGYFGLREAKAAIDEIAPYVAPKPKPGDWPF